jgi:hypothetical protein
VPRRGKRIIFTGKVPVGLKMSLAKLERAVKLKMWESVGRVNMRSFEEAREWARQLGLQSVRQWEAFAPKRPAVIPSSPQSFYANDGWKGWGDFLGANLRRIGGWRSLEDAREWARALRFQSVGNFLGIGYR